MKLSSARRYDSYRHKIYDRKILPLHPGMREECGVSFHSSST
jgi:hypothetical protein